MKRHVWRPLYVVIGLVAFILVFRFFYVPTDFGVQERGYTFGYHRLQNEQEWKDYPAKFKGSAYCAECHDENATSIAESGHGIIPCEDCHGAAFNHPEDPETLSIDRGRDLCLRCHSQLLMPSSQRNDLPGIDPTGHNAGIECADCHNPHNPSLEDM
ncbi:cytochrome c3 family protein [Malonomonas rubra]|uniref:cytochrome c3 family protein n=1 Tax=Malonomonas rubra TaxID=57040 RepID=UPI0026EFA7E1|nr:cytochrome c3 family protein [Malonomonas rubra]